MKLEHRIRLIAGMFILASLGLGHWVSPYWYWFTAFVGLNLIQSSLTKWCLMEDILKKLGWAGPQEPAAASARDPGSLGVAPGHSEHTGCPPGGVPRPASSGRGTDIELGSPADTVHIPGGGRTQEETPTSRPL